MIFWFHAKQRSIGNWQRCSYDIPYNEDIPNSYDYVVNLSGKGYRSLIYRSIVSPYVDILYNITLIN